jgi:hypothetical protein
MIRIEAGPASVLVREAMPGAPMRVGDLVDVVGTQLDESLDERFVGRRGLVTGLFYDDPQSQLPEHPLVVVYVDGLGEELFFAGELRAATDERLRQPMA